MKQQKSFYDPSKKSLIEKLIDAIDYYKEKYGYMPDLCYVNPAMLDGTEKKSRVRVEGYPPLSVGTIWIGLDDSRRIKK